MKYNKISRRHFLQAAGKVAVSLPFLPSLIPLRAQAATTADKCFLALMTEHGGGLPRHIYGPLLDYNDSAPNILTPQSYMAAGIDPLTGLTFPEHTIHYTALENLLQTAQADINQELAGFKDDPDGGASRVSFLLGSKFNPYLKKMNLLRGLDVPWIRGNSAGHGKGCFLGDFAGVQSNPQVPSAPTIDTIMANSSSFYGPGSTPSQKRQVISGQLSVLANGEFASPGFGYTDGLFSLLFGDPSGSSASSATKNKLLVDKILEDANRFRSPATATGKRLSTADKLKVDQFLEGLYEVQRTLSINPAEMCGSPTAPENMQSAYTTFDIPAKLWSAYTHMIALAFACGACRIFTSHIDERFMKQDLPTDLHNEVAHSLNDSADPTRPNMVAHAYLRRFHRQFMDNIFYSVVSILDSYSGPQEGSTVLDQSLVVYQPMSGTMTHQWNNNFALTAGGLAGEFNTGTYIDYRNLKNTAYASSTRHDEAITRSGVPQNQLLATILQAMGLSKSEYEKPEIFGGPGYGYWKTGFNSKNGMVAYAQQHINNSGNPLPVWSKKAG